MKELAFLCKIPLVLLMSRNLRLFYELLPCFLCFLKDDSQLKKNLLFWFFCRDSGFVQQE